MTLFDHSLLNDLAGYDDEERSESALSHLSPKIQLLNRIYIRKIVQRGLLSPSEALAWIDQTVTVFLRHDRVAVFAIVCRQSVAMSDFVTLANATFHIDKVAQRQSNAQQGPLPNLRTVHAFVTGQLIRIADHGRQPDSKEWSSVSYRPPDETAFLRDDDRQPVETSPMVEFVPGPQKVWVPRSSPVSVSVAHPGGQI